MLSAQACSPTSSGWIDTTSDAMPATHTKMASAMYPPHARALGGISGSSSALEMAATDASVSGTTTVIVMVEPSDVSALAMSSHVSAGHNHKRCRPGLSSRGGALRIGSFSGVGGRLSCDGIVKRPIPEPPGVDSSEGVDGEDGAASDGGVRASRCSFAMSRKKIVGKQ